MYDLDMTKHIFDKEVICPVCQNKFKTKVVKVKSPRILSKDSDFFIRYSVANPYFYDVWVCNSCGYAAMKIDFDKIKSYKKDLIMKKITSKWRPREYPDVLNEKLAIERYKLALLNAIMGEFASSTKAMLSLKIAWMYRLLEDKNNETSYLKQALDSFTDAYTNEGLPVYGLERDSLMYLLGELNRRLNNNDAALRWYSKTLTTIGASYKIKEMARNGKNLINNLDV